MPTEAWKIETIKFPMLSGVHLAVKDQSFSYYQKTFTQVLVRLLSFFEFISYGPEFYEYGFVNIVPL